MKVEKRTIGNEGFKPYELVLTIQSEADELILDGIGRMDESITEWLKEIKEIKEVDTEDFLRTLRRYFDNINN